MKRFALIMMALLAVCASSESFAQKNRGKSDKVDMAEKLGLDKEQKEQFSALMTERRTKMKAIFADSGENKSGRSKKVHQEFEVKVKALLTAEQFVNYEKIVEERRKGNKAGKSENSGTPKKKRRQSVKNNR